MAYTGSTLSLMSTTIEGSFSIFLYVTSDSIASVLAANYFSDGEDRGMHVNDVIYAVCGGQTFMLTTIAQSGLAFTAGAVAFAMINGSSLPTSSPPVGSGLLWNNGNFLCVA